MPDLVEIDEIERMDNPTGSVVLLRLSEKPDFPVEAVFAQDVGGNKNPDMLLTGRGLSLVPKTKKQVIIISPQYGCPLRCEYCAVPLTGFAGNVSKDGMLSQVNHLIERFGSERCGKAKVHFARMGDAVFNWENVLGAARELPSLKESYNFLPCLTTVAPVAPFTETALKSFLELGHRQYGGNVQLQFSVNSTDEEQRKRIFRGVPVWSLEQIGQFAEKYKYYFAGGRRITLNFVGAEGYELDPEKLASRINPELFVLKITPVNTSEASIRSGLKSKVSYERPQGMAEKAERLNRLGFTTIVSVTSKAEDDTYMGCGQMAFLNKRRLGAHG